MFNEKTVQYWVKKFPGLTTEIIEELSEDIMERLTREKTFKNNFVDYIPLSLDLKERLANYETVVHNTLRKFPYIPGGLDVFNTRTLAFVVGVEREGERINVNELNDFTLKQTDMIVFSQAKPLNESVLRDRQDVKVPAILLWNDPIAVAKYTRKAIYMQREKTAHQTLKNSIANVGVAERELKIVQDKLKLATENREKAEAFMRKIS